MKKLNKQFHTSNNKTGHGDNYGMGIRNKTARIVDVFGYEKPKAKSNSFPKSLA